jgi:hypothetical protein
VAWSGDGGGGGGGGGGVGRSAVVGVAVFGLNGWGFEGRGFDGWGLEASGAGARAHPIETTVRADRISESNPGAMQVRRMNSPFDFISKVCSLSPLASNTFRGSTVTAATRPRIYTEDSV